MPLLKYKGGDKTASYEIPAAEKTAVEDHVAAFFEKEGYTLEGEDRGGMNFGKGNNILRLILGGLVKRYKFCVHITVTSEHARVVLNKAMSGAWGGWMGYAAMNKETKRLQKALKKYFES